MYTGRREGWTRLPVPGEDKSFKRQHLPLFLKPTETRRPILLVLFQQFPHRLNQRRFYYCMSILHHQVQLVHHTNKGDELVAYMARVSNPSNQNNTKTSAKLISYLIKHKHWSPFEMVNMCVEIETTRSIAAQILRHRSFSFQEFSQRYADASLLGTGVMPELRLQDPVNRQNSIEVEEEDLFLKQEIKQLYKHSELVYRKLLEAGVAKECARDVLPLSTPTRMYMNGTLRSWIHYCDLRCSNGTQKEHKVIADQCKQLIAMCFPACYAAVWAA